MYVRGFLFSLIAIAGGCSAAVTPPRAPARPTVVYLCDYGYHSSLLLPVGEGKWVEYLFGDWDWAALQHTGALAVVRAGFFSSQATLGRRYFYPSGHDVHPITLPATQVPLTVDGTACHALEKSLNVRWLAHAGTAVDAGAAGDFYVYVKDDEPYGLLHNCNRETADWLNLLGCRTCGIALTSHFKVEAAK